MGSPSFGLLRLLFLINLNLLFLYYITCLIKELFCEILIVDTSSVKHVTHALFMVLFAKVYLFFVTCQSDVRVVVNPNTLFVSFIEVTLNFFY